MTDSVLFYGLGSMGTGMAHSLRRAGFRVNAFTNKPEVRQAFIDAGVRAPIWLRLRRRLLPWSSQWSMLHRPKTSSLAAQGLPSACPMAVW